MERLATALGPDGANRDGALADLLDSSADVLDGNGLALGDVTGLLADERDELGGVLDVAPLAAGNLLNTYNGTSGTLDTRADVNELNQPPIVLVCKLLQSVEPGRVPGPLSSACRELEPLLSGALPLPGGADLGDRPFRVVAPPADAVASLRQSALLGEKFVELAASGSGAAERLGDGAVNRFGGALAVRRDQVAGALDGLEPGLRVLADQRTRLVALLTSLDPLADVAADTVGRNRADLRALLDGARSSTAAATEHLPRTTALIRDGAVVLDTQARLGGQVRGISAELRALAERLKSSDGDLRRLIAVAPGAAEQVAGLPAESGTAVGALLANLLTTADVVVTRLDGIEQLAVTYPLAIAGARTVAPGDGRARFGLALNVLDPLPCAVGYEGTRIRQGADTATAPPLNGGARCALARGSATGVRGAQNAPHPGVPSTPGGGEAEQPGREPAAPEDGAPLLIGLGQLLGLPG
ncbi:hypothetical protein [Actinosynnema mirum]|uniref:ABC-type transport system involved in resistance to organic solvents periplasmic component n=1 Tax=Actinosynnema mirum (strain ATCC 29888 / DSM 43827 / JCM 3225 / NBRC 14064 / NCIMB 13271 / NRRL B-12336 / IMRU 3971 / 101) TaxID=446462 RepID=C6WN63_ACTMD|nr:hypothetical protein [Actinosynnema mirum]ACU40427.1 ABC-type transport system involved in resistance to organic solvents periplasmic component [Actinosynnema mirum DSM 43827]